MSWTDEELDGLVRDAANSNHVEYKETYWHEMEAMLGAEKSSKIGMWWWMSGLILFIGLTSLFVGSANGVFGSKEQMASTTGITKNEKLANGNIKTAGISSNASYRNDYTETDKIENGIAADSDELNSNDVAQPVQSQQTKVNNRNNVQSKSTKSLDVQNVKQTQQTQQIQRIQPNKMILAVQTSQDDADLASNDVNLASRNETNTVGENKDETDVTKDELNKPIHKELAQNLLETKDWSNEINHDPINHFDQLPLFATKRIGLYVAVSGGIGQSYAMTNSNNEMYQFGANGGIEFYRKNWAFGIGLGVRQQFTNNLDLINRRQYYSFGSVNVNQNVSYDRLLLGDVQLSASRRFGRSEIGITVSPNYLIGARMSAFQTVEEIIGAKSTMANESTTKKQYVHSNNFNSFGLNAGLNYSYSIMQNVSIYTALNARIGQPLLKANFDGENRRVPLMVEIGLKKRF